MYNVLIPTWIPVAENISQEFVGHKHICILFCTFLYLILKKKRYFLKQKLKTSIDDYHSLGFWQCLLKRDNYKAVV